MLMKVALPSLLLLALSNAALADQCDVVELNCLESATLSVGGSVLNDVCIRVQKTEDCTLSDPVNSCADLTPLAKNPTSPLGNNQCNLIEETCTDFAFGQCNEWAREFECFNAAAIMGDAVLENRRFSNLQEEFSQDCRAVEANPDCSFERSEITMGFATRIINARSVTRSWWQRQHRYDCSVGSVEDTCQAFDAQPICRQTGQVTCLAYDSEGRCIAQTEQYLCESDTSFAPQCAVVEVCEDGSCDPEEDEPNGDYAQAAAWLNFLDEATKNTTCEVGDPSSSGVVGDVDVDDCAEGTFANGETEPLVFTGQRMYCTTHVFSSCSQNAELYARIQAGAAHFLRSQCRGFFCTSRRHYYCTYNSKFARVFQEQAHLQTGVQFTNACPGFTIEQLETLDVEAMDLSEIFGDMLAEAQEPIQDLVIDRLSQELGVFQLDIEGTLGGGGQ
jgi:conjugal transfer mating pair stabilization protein TraN